MNWLDVQSLSIACKVGFGQEFHRSMEGNEFSQVTSTNLQTGTIWVASVRLLVALEYLR